jgi:hypothetical protein
MGNHLNYRCPQCGRADEIEICAIGSVRLTGNGADMAEVVIQDLDGSSWSADYAAGCGACGYTAAVRDFSALPPGVVSLNEYRHRR